MYGFFRAACAVPSVFVGDALKNTEEIIKKMKEAAQKNASLLVCPELSVTGYTCGDLFLQETLLLASNTSLSRICRESEVYDIATVVGAPIEISGTLYNCAVVIAEGMVKGIVPKTFIPNHGEFSEKRYFASCHTLKKRELCSSQLGFKEKYQIPVGEDILFNICGVKVGIEICEDLWAPISPSAVLSMSGAEVIVNLSASSETATKNEYRRELVKTQSSRIIAGYIYTSSGSYESTTDVVMSGSSIIAENGKITAINNEGVSTDYLLITDMDIDRIHSSRRKNTTFRDCAKIHENADIRVVDTIKKENFADGRYFKIEKNPFVPDCEAERQEKCLKIFDMQTKALQKRLKITGAKAVVGVSGGLDSTLAILVCVNAMKRLKRPASDVIGITMPCFGTSVRTYQNSLGLMESLGVTMVEINIKDACIKHFEDIGHSMDAHDLTYENAQARERTQILMDYAGKTGGMVVGTGDMSELALGWCTYNGDHMSMYGVNTGVPKTLIRYIIEGAINEGIFKGSESFLNDICLTPISPELLPLDESGKISQQTEDIVGPYALHDFFLYYVVGFGFTPLKIYNLAKLAFDGEYDDETIIKWLKYFYKRFFTQQFKRSCLPDGVKIEDIGLSPRGDWRMPSDASWALWIDEIERM